MFWKPKKKTKILLYLRDGWRGTGWLMQKIGGIWKPKKKTKILIEGWRGTGWVMQKFGGIWKPKKKTKILLEGRMEGNWLGDAEIWRDLKTQKKN